MFDRHAKLAFILAAVTLTLSGIGFKSSVRALNVFLKKKPVELRQQFSNMPKTLDHWRAAAADVRLDEASIESLGTHQYLTRWYERETENDASGGVIILHVAYYTGLIDAVPHVPDRCLVAAGLRDVGLPVNLALPVDRSGWTDDPERINRATGLPYPRLRFADRITARARTVRMPIGDFRVRTTEFRDDSRSDFRIFAGYFFIANGRVVASPEGVRRLAFDTTDEYAYFAKVQFTMFGGPDLDVDLFVDSVTDLTDRLLPELMLCLPDWSEVDGSSGEDAGGSER